MSKNELSDSFLILKILLLILVNIILITVFVIIYVKRKSQIILSRSPYLLLISLFIVFIYTICNLLDMIIPNTMIVRKLKLQYHCHIFNFNSNMTAFFIYLCYFLRAERISRIYKIAYNEKVAITQEETYVKIFIVISVFLSTGYVILVNFIPLYKILFFKSEHCLMSYDTSKLPEYYVSLSLLIVKGLMFMYSIISLKNITKDIYLIRIELIPIFVLFLINEVLKFISDYQLNESFADIYTLTFKISLFLIMLIFSGILVILNCLKYNKIPICGTVETIENFSLLLYNKTSINSFYQFLFKNHKEGKYLLIIFIKLFILNEKLISQPKNKPSITDKIKEVNLLLNYFVFNKNNKNLIDFENKFIFELDLTKYDNNTNQLTNQIKYLLDLCFSKLKNDYFPLFQNSIDYKLTVLDLVYEEIVFSRLCVSADLDYNLADIEF